MVKQPKTVKQADLRLKSLKKQKNAVEKLRKSLAKKVKSVKKKKPAKKKKAAKRKSSKKKKRR